MKIGEPNMSDIYWPAVASWLRKEASEHARQLGTANKQDRVNELGLSRIVVDVFMGLARAIDYGIETQELTKSKDWIAK